MCLRKLIESFLLLFDDHDTYTINFIREIHKRGKAGPNSDSN